MDHNYSTTITPKRERGQHLKFEDRCNIKVYKSMGWSYRKIAAAVNCSPSTVMYELQRGTGERNGVKGRFPEYSAERGQANYQSNRSRCRKAHKVTSCRKFVDWMTKQVRERKWSFDACTGYAKREGLFPAEHIPCTKTLYNELWARNLPLAPLDVPEAISRKKKMHHARKNKHVFGTSIEARPALAAERSECGHWEIDTVIGRKAGKESVVLTIVEKKTDYYIALKAHGKDADSVMAALLEVKEEIGTEQFAKVFKTITADNGTEFSRLSELAEWGVGVYFAHPYSSWERAQNERHNRLFRRYVPKGTSIEKYSNEQIMHFADEMNALPRRHLGYATPEMLFEDFLDQVFSAS